MQCHVCLSGASLSRCASRSQHMLLQSLPSKFTKALQQNMPTCQRRNLVPEAWGFAIKRGITHCRIPGGCWPLLLPSTILRPRRSRRLEQVSDHATCFSASCPRCLQPALAYTLRQPARPVGSLVVPPGAVRRRAARVAQVDLVPPDIAPVLPFTIGRLLGFCPTLGLLVSAVTWRPPNPQCRIQLVSGRFYQEARPGFTTFQSVMYKAALPISKGTHHWR
jgi:hypothetical protein